MFDDVVQLDRRLLLAVSTGLLVPSLGLAASPPPSVAFPPGKPGDFDFLAGKWSIRHRFLRNGSWDEFGGEATCWTILGGAGSVEELRIPERDFNGMGLRLLDRERQLWLDFWVNAKAGVLGADGMPGGFKDGVGTFIADDGEGPQRVLSRGVWDHITKRSHRWSQAFSKDGGKTWQDTWFMEWVRAA